MKRLIARIKAKTPKRNKLIGKTCTILSAVSTALLTSGYVKSTNWLIVLTIMSAVCGGGALYNAQKVEE